MSNRSDTTGTLFSFEEGAGVRLLFFLFSLLVYISLGYFTLRVDFLQLIILYSTAFVLYAFWYQSAAKSNRIKESLIAAMLLRISLLFYLPNLSDDFYRFIWDGRLLTQGINPFNYLPSELMNLDIAKVDPAIFEKLNSKEYYSIYPPLNQAVFYLSTLISSTNLLGNVIVMKLFILSCELGTILLGKKLLEEFKMNQHLILLYALNPLVIAELTGNIHFEAAMIFFCVLSIYLIVRGKFLLSAASLSIAICTKLWPIMFVPFFYKRFFKAEDESNTFRGISKYIAWLLSVLFFTSVFFFPFYNKDLLPHIGSSINLYFQHFEFNASIFYIIRWIGFQTQGYDVIHSVGHWLPVMVTTILMIYFLLEKKPLPSNAFRTFLFSLIIYLLFATIVHPWYITPLVMFCLFTPFRYPLIWSALLPLTYIAYTFVPAKENAGLIAIEYLSVVIFAIAELLMMRGFLTLKK